MLMARCVVLGFTDAAGPADWILIALVFALGAIGATIVTYTTLGWVQAQAANTRLKSPPLSSTSRNYPWVQTTDYVAYRFDGKSQPRQGHRDLHPWR